jgi:DNA invertase Pin-like site-specific DNA recombinase
MDVYGYARVSTQDQNLDRQLSALKEYGIPDRYIFSDKASGKDFNRRAYNALVGTVETVPLLHRGDLLVIYSIDRLGRNYAEIRTQWQHITTNLGADIVVLDMPLLDTRTTEGNNLDKRFVSDLVLQILSYVAEKERANNLTRQKQGIAVMPIDPATGKRVSKRTGRATGRPCAQYPTDWNKIYSEWKSGQMTALEAMAELGLTHSTFYKLVGRFEGKVF